VKWGHLLIDTAKPGNTARPEPIRGTDMSTPTTALHAEYDRVITARFVTKRDGSPMHCITCNTPLVQGTALAAVNSAKQWHSYCPDCAADMAVQIRGLFSRLIELGATVPDATQDLVRAFLAAEGPTTFLAAKRALMTLRDDAGKAAAEAERAERVAALQGDPVFTALALATTPGLLSERDRSFAESLADQWERKGKLSERQMPYAIKLGDKARKADAKGTVTLDWSAEVSALIEAAGLRDGYYAVDYDGTVAHQDTTFVRILTGDTGVRYMRHIVGGQGETPSGGRDWCVHVVGRIAVAGADESMRRYGRQIGRCCLCHRTLTDLPSRQAGIGPVCAAR